MDWQLLLVIVLVVLALLYLGRRMLRTWRGNDASCGGCKRPSAASIGHSSAETVIPIEQVKLRRR
jgi:hypothetical protein